METTLNITKQDLNAGTITEEHKLFFGHVFRGKSAYQYAVESGLFEGTEEEFAEYHGNIKNTINAGIRATTAATTAANLANQEAQNATEAAREAVSIAEEKGVEAVRLATEAAEKIEQFEGKLNTKQDTLVSGENIKTVGGQSILGNGDLLIPPTTEIWYTSVDGEVVHPYALDVFGANIVSNTYENGKGVIVFDGDVTMIGKGAFGIPATSATVGSIPLTSVALPDSVTEIGESAFRDCWAIATFLFPKGLRTIGASAFRGCCSLSSITIPESVTTIGEYAFFNCRSITSATIPDSVTEIGESAFSSCLNLASFGGKYAHSFGTYLIFDNKLISVVPASNIIYAIPSSVKAIGARAFYGCTSRTSITIPSSVTSIGANAFYGCSGELVLNGMPNENYTASNAPMVNGWLYGSNFSKITIGSSVKAIGQNTFYGCSGELVIKSTELVEKNYTTSNYPYKAGWLMGAQFSTITIASPITTIGNAVFRDLTSLKEVTIEDSVTSINTSSFYGCTGLQDINFGTGLLSIGSSAFKGCTALSSVTLPEGVTSVGNTVFEGCSNLEKILFPSTTTSIGSSVVGSSVRAFCCTATTPPTLSNSLSYLHKNCVVVVPKGALDTYKTATNWSVKADAEKMAGSELLEYFDNELFWVLVRMELKVQNSVLGSIIG